MNTFESPKRTAISHIVNPTDTPVYQPSSIPESSHSASYKPHFTGHGYGHSSTSWSSNASYGATGNFQSPRSEQRGTYGSTHSSHTHPSSHLDVGNHHNHTQHGEAGNNWARGQRAESGPYMDERTTAHHIDVDTQVYQMSARPSLRVAARNSLPPSSRSADYHRYPQEQSVSIPDTDSYDRRLESTVIGRPQQDPLPAPNNRKRASPDTESVEKPKAKRPKAKKASSPSAPSKGKRVTKAAAQNEIPEYTGHVLNGETVMLSTELQLARCMSEKYRKDPPQILPRCVACTRRSLGDTCRFQGVRYLLRDKERTLQAIGFRDTIPSDAHSQLDFPKEWNRALEADPIQRSKISIARALLPTLKAEKEHIKAEKIIRRPRETSVRVTCDTCMTSIFSTTFMCRTCGREICHDCFELVRQVTEVPQNGSPEELAAFTKRREKHIYEKPFFLMCLNRKEHGFAEFDPVTRFVQEELDQVVSEMEALLDQDVGKASPEPMTGLGPSQSLTDGASPHNTTRNDSSAATREANTTGSELSYDVATFPDPVSSPLYDSYTPSNVGKLHTNIPSGRLQIIPAALYDAVTTGGDSKPCSRSFSDLWKKGLPLLVKDVLPRFRLDWTPQYFTDHFGSKETMVIECQTDSSTKMTIKEFFSHFGQYEGRANCWKVKDFPPAAEFKQEFPKLFEDFSNAVPVPDYVRRDGVFNIASHFPVNAIGPDLGPKMYNAFASSQEAGSKGSTRLHMDMADALNVMMYATNCEDGTEGYAVWDIFRAEDSEDIRKFLRQKYGYQKPEADADGSDSGSGGSSKKKKAPTSKKGKAKAAPKVAATPVQIIGHDPIHGQQFYLDVELRKELYDTYGVESLRVYQRPGDGVFIPAGCAHQVANMADCMKIAIDFVSPENIDRCEKLTKEFREQNQAKAWKEDVLQLRTMMWFAWQSCAANEKALPKKMDEDTPAAAP